jgi:hypothetical protein
MDKDLWKDVQVMLEACKQDWTIIEKAKNQDQEILWDNNDIVMACVEQDWRAFTKATTGVKHDRAIALVAVKQSYQAIEKMPIELNDKYWNDEEIVTLAVTQDGMNLRNALPAMRETKRVALTAIRSNWKAVEFAGDAFRNDREVALACVAQDWHAIDAVTQDGTNMLNAKKFWADKEVVLSIVSQEGSALQFASDLVRADKKVVLAAVQTDGLALEFASPALQGDRGIVTAAVTQNGGALDFAAEELQKIEELVMLAEGAKGHK